MTTQSVGAIARDDAVDADDICNLSAQSQNEMIPKLLNLDAAKVKTK